MAILQCKCIFRNLLEKDRIQMQVYKYKVWSSHCAEVIFRVNNWDPAIHHWQPLQSAPLLSRSLSGVRQHFWKQSQVFLKSCLLIFYIMLPASGTSCTELIPTGSIETVVLTGVCSTTFLLMVCSDVTVKARKHRDQHGKQKDHRNAPWKSLF